MNDFGVILLAGGKSSRMGEDKGLMSLFGKPMAEYVLEKVNELTNNVIIITENSNYSQFGYPIYKDLIKNCGPLGGIYTGLMKSEHDLNLIVSCDIPYVKSGLIKFLYYQTEDFEVTVPMYNDRIHPLIGFYKKSCIEKIKYNLDEEKYKVADVFKYCKTNVVDTDEFDEIVFKNVNSKKDIQPF
ncbi:molybdenum cofactor guanylyltransferase [Paracrocinitomix mangrovi]|uniref:molybdenum cofactor guanylyltransferase n=1 Tax=Paracrocinitomix mangrovi TaxID=2862509 RepID=UPI001C8D24BC|nr:molybdenum cofactor guanylyltransferase [Paracrocinitomix mangrovi]UKN03201.1 molybdenum cofactor guanylyltransferase [Paracrocinitomix mangrovi]